MIAYSVVDVMSVLFLFAVDCCAVMILKKKKKKILPSVTIVLEQPKE